MSVLARLSVLELGGVGPLPFAGMLLSDMGASVIRLDPTTPVGWTRDDAVMRGRRCVRVDIKTPAGLDIVRRLIQRSDVLLEGYRPGVMERLGIDAALCHEANPALVVGRMTGWGQKGPLAQQPGHDINFVSMSGALHAIGEANRGPVHPLNLVGDYGGAFLLVVGVLAAVLEASSTGTGQTVDAAMLDAAALMMTKWYGELDAGRWQDRRGCNRVDGGAHYYRIYETQDGAHLAVGALEPKFYDNFLSVLGYGEVRPSQDDVEGWNDHAREIQQVIGRRTRAEWEQLFEGRSACVTPVLTMTEAAMHSHMFERAGFVNINGAQLPAPAPRFSKTQSSPGRAAAAGDHTKEVLGDLGLTRDAIKDLFEQGVVA